MMIIRRSWRVWVGVLIGLGCFGIVHSAHADNRLQLTVSIVPQKYFVERIGGSQVQVTVYGTARSRARKL